MELFRDTNFDFLGRKWPFIIASLVVTVVGLGSMLLKGGPRYGIDLKGGALVYVKFADKPPVEQLRSLLGAKLPGGTPEIQEVTGTNEVIIGTEMREERELARARELIIDTLSGAFGQKQTGKLDVNNSGQQAAIDRLRTPLSAAGVSLSDQQLQALVASIWEYRNTPPRSGIIRSLDELSGVSGVTPQVIQVLKQEAFTAPYAIRNVEVVGPRMGQQLQRQALYVVLSALAGMLVYVGLRFEWIYGLAAVIAVFHDTIITLGLFSLFDKEISLTVIAALLTLIGYSMNDTIVVFDRIRENLKINKRMGFSELVNMSINQTLSRTVLTSGLTLLTAISLLLLGGPVLHGFSFALVVGIIVGTFSSIFIASPILIFWRELVEKRKQSSTPAPGAGTGRRVPVKA
ncbi:MAG: protein translocase subunit SecF, partial [Bryobacteraceae bacterium]|nr:protein translocase subunit SecF [Bryobacteraceae bacterium]